MNHMVRQTLAAAVLGAGLLLCTATGVQAGNGNPIDNSAKPMDIAVIGDVPYGDSALALFPALIEDINRDPKVRLAVHVGDTKSGSTECSDEWSEEILSLFYAFNDPLIYSIGDNEWTDCHRANNGSYDPNERLAAIRDSYFAVPGTSLARTIHERAKRGRGDAAIFGPHGPRSEEA